jgi:proline dehydrogenase
MSRICRQNLIRILERARQHSNFVRIDIEDTPYTDITISIYEAMLERGFTPKHGHGGPVLSVPR